MNHIGVFLRVLLGLCVGFVSLFAFGLAHVALANQNFVFWGGGGIIILTAVVVGASLAWIAFKLIGGAFAFVLARVRAALGQIGLDVEQRGISDLVYQGRKVSGSGQRRRRRNVLVHGYTEVDLDIVHDVLVNRLGDLEAFIVAIRLRL